MVRVREMGKIVWEENRDNVDNKEITIEKMGGQKWKKLNGGKTELKEANKITRSMEYL